MAITLIFWASMNSQETFTDDHQQILSDIYRKDAQAKKRNEKIDLVLRDRKLDSKFIIQLPFSRLATLELSNCQLDDLAISCLMKEMQQIPDLPLQALDLSNNTFGFKGAEALAEALPKLTKLQKLDLSSNEQLNDEAVCKIAKVLEGKSPLQHLDLSFLNISHKETADTIAKLSVEHLDLNGCQFPPEYLEMIRAAIQEQKGELAATTIFSPETENNESSEHSEYKKNLNTINISGYTNLTVCCAKQQQPQAPDTLPNNDSGMIVQNC